MALSVCAVMCARGARVLASPRTKGASEGLLTGPRGGAGQGSPRRPGAPAAAPHRGRAGRGDASHPAGRALRADGHAGLHGGDTAGQRLQPSLRTAARPRLDAGDAGRGCARCRRWQGPAASGGSRLQALRSQRRWRWGTEAQPCHGQVWVSAVGTQPPAWSLGARERLAGPCRSHQPQPGTVPFGDRDLTSLREPWAGSCLALPAAVRPGPARYLQRRARLRQPLLHSVQPVPQGQQLLMHFQPPLRPLAPLLRPAERARDTRGCRGAGHSQDVQAPLQGPLSLDGTAMKLPATPLSLSQRLTQAGWCRIHPSHHEDAHEQSLALARSRRAQQTRTSPAPPPLLTAPPCSSRRARCHPQRSVPAERAEGRGGMGFSGGGAAGLVPAGRRNSVGLQGCNPRGAPAHAAPQRCLRG